MYIEAISLHPSGILPKSGSMHLITPELEFSLPTLEDLVGRKIFFPLSEIIA
jgi:hypothetical protein